MDALVQDDRLVEQARRMQSILMAVARPPEEHSMPDLELSYREIRLLLALGEMGEATMTDLAGMPRVPLSTLTRMVDRLIRKGMVVRSRSEKDRRIVVVQATEKANTLGETIKQHRYQISLRMLEPLTPGEREILLELMEKMAAAGMASSAPQQRGG